MKRSKFSEHEIIAILKAVEAGRTVKDVCREHEISEATYYQWKSKYGGMQASDIKRLRELEEENRCLKQISADLLLENRGAERCDPKKALTPAVKRELVVTLRGEYGLSERRACAAVNLRRSVYWANCKRTARSSPSRFGRQNCRAWKWHEDSEFRVKFADLDQQDNANHRG